MRLIELQFYPVQTSTWCQNSGSFASYFQEIYKFLHEDKAVRAYIPAYEILHVELQFYKREGERDSQA